MESLHHMYLLLLFLLLLKFSNIHRLRSDLVNGPHHRSQRQTLESNTSIHHVIGSSRVLLCGWESKRKQA